MTGVRRERSGAMPPRGRGRPGDLMALLSDATDATDATESFPRMARNFYFEKDATAVAGSANFAARVAAGYAGLGLTSAQSAAFSALDAALQTAYAAATAPLSRTRIAVSTKD